MSLAAFISPAVIHRAAALRAEEMGSPSRRSSTARGLAIEGSTASLPVRYVVTAALFGIQGLRSTLMGAGGEDKARAFGTYGYPIQAVRPA